MTPKTRAERSSPSADTGARLARSSVFRVVAFALQALISLAMTPIIVHALGERMYGFWTLVGTFVGYYGIMDMGVSSAVTRYVSRALGQCDEEEINRVASTSFFLFAGVAVLVVMVTIAVAFLSFLVVRDAAEYRVVRLLLLVLGARVALSFPARVFAGMLNAHLRHDLTACATMAQLLAGNGCIYLFLRHGGGVLGMSLLVLGAALIEYLLNLASALRVFPKLVLSRGMAQRRAFSTIFHYSWKTVLAQAAGILRSRVGGFIVAGFLGVNMVVYYTIAMRLVEYYTEFVHSLVGNLAPAFSRYEGEQQDELISSQLMFFTKISVILCVFIAASLVFYGRAFIERWMGAGFETSYRLLALLAVPYAVSLMQTPASCLLFGVSKHHYLAVFVWCDAIISLVCGLLFVNLVGIYGVAAGTAVGLAVTSLFLCPVFVCRVARLRLSTYCLDGLLWPTLKSLGLLLPYGALVHRFLESNYGIILSLVLLQALLFAPAAFALVLDDGERVFVRNCVSMVVAKRRAHGDPPM